MDSNNENPISDTEERQATSPDILSSEDNKKEQEIQYQKTEGKIVPGDSSLVSVAESGNATDNEKGLDAASNADSPSSTVSATGNEAPCLGKEVGAPSESPSPRTSPENVCDDSKGEKQASKCVVSSQPPLTSAEAVEGEKGKEAEQNVATSTQTVPPTCVIQNGETSDNKEVEPCIALDNSLIDSAVQSAVELREHFDKFRKLVIDMTSTTSDSPKSRVSSLKDLASQKIVAPGRRSAHSIKETDSKNKKETSPVTTSLKPPALRAESGDSSSSENREAQTENTALLTTREPEDGGNCEDERKAFFYMSSRSVPGMGEGSEWPSVSADFQMPSEQPARRIVRQRSQEHSGVCTQCCHYIIVAIALLATITGCITYHLSDSGILPEVLRPIGASTAFVSFVLCVFSAVYYLSDHTRLPILPNYELLDDVDSVMALNRASNPEFYDSDDGHNGSRTAASDYCLRETQSADAIDRRGYGRRSTESLQGEVKRCSDEAGTSYSTRPPKKFKVGSTAATGNASELAQDASAERMIALPPCSSQENVETNGGTTQHSLQASDELSSSSQSCDQDSESDESPLLPEDR